MKVMQNQHGGLLGTIQSLRVKVQDCPTTANSHKIGVSFVTAFVWRVRNWTQFSPHFVRRMWEMTWVFVFACIGLLLMLEEMVMRYLKEV